VRRWGARHDPAGLVRSHWADVTELLNWWGAGREPGQTDDEFAARAGHILARRLREPSPWLAGGVVRLAALATEAAFAPAVPAERAEQATLVAREIHQRLFRRATASQLLRWAVSPRPGRRSDLESETGGRHPAPGGQLIPGPWQGSTASLRGAR
jgi:hypothetical protein